MNWLRLRLKLWLGVLEGDYDNFNLIQGIRRDLGATNDLLLRVEQRQAADDVKHLAAYDKLEAELNALTNRIA